MERERYNPQEFPKPPDRPRRPGTFDWKTHKPNNPGRKKGTPNKTTQLLKDAILQAAANVGDQKHAHRWAVEGGLVGYLEWIARTYPEAFVQHLLQKVLPMQIAGPDGKTVNVKYTVQEAVVILQEKGIRVDALFDKAAEILPAHKPLNGAGMKDITPAIRDSENEQEG